MAWDGVERRKINRMSDSFQPQTTFEGYVKGILDSIESRLNHLPCPESFKRLGKVENDVANIKGKATVFGALMGFIAGILAKIFIGK